MLSKKLFRWLNKIALFAVVFASLAPGISHAIAAQNGTNGFVQEVCTTNGEKITINVTTTKGQQRAAEFNIKQPADAAPKNMGMHLEHCPFCANASTDMALPAPHAPIIAVLTALAQQVSASTQATLPHFSALPPPAQAPPSIL